MERNIGRKKNLEVKWKKTKEPSEMITVLQGVGITIENDKGTEEARRVEAYKGLKKMEVLRSTLGI